MGASLLVPIHAFTYQGRKFIADFSRTPCGLFYVYLVITTVYHPPTSSQMKRYNKKIFAMIRPFIAEHKRD